MSIPSSAYSSPVSLDKKAASSPSSSSGLASGDRTADSAVQTCPYKDKAAKNKDKPCDVETLSIVGGTRSVKTDSPRYRRPKPAPPKLPTDKAELMKSYDLVLEIIAMPRLTAAATKSKDGEDFHGDGVPLTITESHFGACPDKKHSKITVTPVGMGIGDPEQTVTVVQSKLPPYKVWGKALVQDASDSASLMDVWPFRETLVKNVTVCTESCGVRLAGAVKNSFLGLVRVYRKEEWELKIGMPTLLVAKRSLDKNMVMDETTKESSTEVAGVTFSKNKTVTDEKGVKSKETSTYDVEKGKLKETTKERGERKEVKTADVDVGAFHKTVTTKVPKEKGEGKGKKTVTTHTIDLPVTLSRNGKEFGITRLINDILKLASQAKETLNAALEIVPKVGFSMSLDVGVCEGSISGKWGYRPDVRLDSDEYKWVMPYLDLEIDVTFLRIAFSVMFGIDVKSPSALWVEEGYLVSIVLKVQLSLTVTAGLKASAHLAGAPDESKEDDEAPINGKGQGVFEGTAALTLLGESVKAVAGTDIEVEVKGTCYYGLKSGFWIGWTLSRSAWIVYAYARSANREGEGGSSRYEREIWPKNENWTSGTLFK